jgi:Transposase.
MKKSVKFSPEVRERSVRMVLEHQGEYESQWAAICSIAAKVGCTPETLRRWVRESETDSGARPGTTTAEQERIKALEREVRELRQANEILRNPTVVVAGRACAGGGMHWRRLGDVAASTTMPASAPA